MNGTLEPAEEPKKKIPTGLAPKRERTLSNIPFEKVCQILELCGEVAQFATANYKDNLAIEANLQAMTPVKRLIKTGAGPQLVNRSFQHLTWINRIRLQHFF